MDDTVRDFLSQARVSGQTHALRALWHAHRGDWEAAHQEAQEGNDADSAWVHALLHRQEGDQANAAYWYRRAGRPMFHGDLKTEQEAILAALLPSAP